MSGVILNQLAVSLKLHVRNKMALIYSYLFPTIFLVAFWVLYRYEQVPLARHMGELLTVTVLGGACFGLPTTMVSERERGVWRRYRLAPAPTGSLVAGTLVARYLLLIVAGLLQLALAMGIGMPLPRHPLELFVAFTCVAFAFIGLGLVIAMMADNVPAVQALGQCIFLPMLIIGGVAVPLASLPDWAQRLSTFFPGRYAVDAMQACVTGNGLLASRQSLIALLVIGAAGCLAGAKLFRWDAQQRFSATPAKGWVAVALAAWVAVGLSAETRRARTSPAPTPAPAQAAVVPGSSTAAENAPAPAPAPVLPPPPAPNPTTAAPETAKPATTTASAPAPHPSNKPATGPGTSAALPPVATLPESAPPKPSPPPPSPETGEKRVATWRAVTMDDIDRDLIFTRLPPDDGVVTPVARAVDLPEPEVEGQLDQMRTALIDWAPGKVEDPVQRVRNFLYVPAVIDVFQMEGLEQFVPLLIFERLQEVVPKDDLIKILYWIALHPFEGDDKAVDELRPLGLKNGPADIEATRERVGIYAVKLLGRVTGRIQAKS